MANIEKKEIIDKITSKVEDGDLKMELLEDITDSFNDNDKIDKKLYDDLVIERDLYKTKYNDLQNKYISRFTSVETPTQQPKMMDIEPIEEQKKVIDVQSIFR